MMPETLTVSSEQFILTAIVLALVDAAFVLLLAWRVRPSRFCELRWALVGTAAVFWSVFGVIPVREFWESTYRSFYPSWLRSGGTLLFVPLGYGLLALIYHTVALRLPGNPLVGFCLLGGIESLFEHVWAIYGFRILQLPILQAATPLSILLFSILEYIFYLSLVISLAVIFRRGWRWLKSSGAGTAGSICSAL